jgi:hypothetical protein
MMRLFGMLALSAGFAGCVAAQPYDYGYGGEPVPAYGSGPGYYGPRIGVGVGGGNLGGAVGGGVGVGVGF